MKTQNHTKWDCTYHVVLVPKYRKKVLYKAERSILKEIIKDLCRQKDVEILKGNAKPDHVHLLLSIPPKLSVSQTVGFLKGKSAIRMHNEKGCYRRLGQKKFWSRGFFVRTTGLDTDAIKRYIEDQWKDDQLEDGDGIDNNW